MSIKSFFTISRHKIYTKSISKLHYNSTKRLNMHMYASNIREKLGSGFVRIFGEKFQDLRSAPIHIPESNRGKTRDQIFEENFGKNNPI